MRDNAAHDRKSTPLRSRFALFAASLGVCFVAVQALDLAIGRLQPQGAGLLFERHSAAHYETDEFSFTAQINDLGLRDRPLSLSRGSRARILAVGDSFTFGWGVALSESWPKQLEERLRDNGVDAEVVIVARSGGSPCDYADFAESAVPLLDPDLVVVALLQGDDLAQLHTAGPCTARPPAASPWWAPRHLIGALRGLGAAQVEDVSAAWRQQAAEFRETLTGSFRRIRYERVAPVVRAAFEAGRFNPGLVSLAVNRPGYFQSVLDLDAEPNRDAVASLTGALRRIDAVAREAGARTAILSVPLGAYVSPGKHARYLETGFVLSPDALETNAMDAAFERAATAAGLPFYAGATAVFRAGAAVQARFFPFDGHFTAEGNRQFAEAIAPFVRAQLEQGRSGAISPTDGS